jgi:Mg-chelatase subunit ChlD
MPNPPQPPKRSWRDDAGARGAAKKREWQKEPGGTSAGPRLGKRMKILLAGGGLLAILAGVVVMWLLLRRPDSPRLVLIGAGYETNLAVPHNVYGKRALGDLKAWADDHNQHRGGDSEHRIDVHQEELTADSDPFAKALKGCTSKTVVVFVAVHGAGSAGQGAYLIPNNTSPRDGVGGYTMDKALAALDQLPKDTKKLLILDTTQITSNWHLGMLHNDFVHSLANDSRAKNIPNLLIFCASDEDQRSWVSEEYGRSIFAHFVVEGLKGAADKDDDGRLTAQELIDYVRENVESWVRHNRGTLQTPRVIGPDGLAKDMELVAVERSQYKEPDAGKLTKWTPPEDLIKEWKERDDLAKSFPHPATYTPHLWRQYHETLLRYEQLTRAGDDADAETMSQELRKLTGKIRQQQRIEKDALALTLATPAALGWALPEADEAKIRQEFKTLWDAGAKPNEFKQALKRWQNSAGGDSNMRHLVRVRVDAILLDRARGSEADFLRACEILPGVDDELLPRRPAEAHFALMVKEYALANKPEWQRVRAELLTRLHAEQAALGLPRSDDGRQPDSIVPYSEQLLPWIRKDVETADTSRRLREDLLFASPKALERLGLKPPDDAEPLYEKVQKRAGDVRDALQKRDQVLAELPFYTLWLSRLPLAEDEEKAALETWDAVHTLCRLLDDPKPDNVTALQEPLEKMRSRHDDIAKRFREACDKELKDHSTNQQNWHDLQNLLSVPLIPANVRRDLLTELGNVGFELNAGTKQAEQRTAVDKDQVGRQARAVAQRQGRFAIRMLGIDNQAAKEMVPTVDKPEGEWQRSLNRAADQLAAEFGKQTRGLYEDTEKARKAPLSEAAPLLHSAALRVRFVTGAAAAAWPALDPVAEDRNVRMYELLKWQAERTFADYWAMVTPDDPRTPYYRSAAGQYVAAAKSLAGNDSPDLSADQKAARTDDLAKLEKTLAAPDRIEPRWRDGDVYLAGPATLHVTDEDRVTRTFGLDCPATTPDGYPVVWEVLGKSLQPANKEDLERRVLAKVPRKVDEVRVQYELIPERPRTPNYEKEKTQYTLKGFYRGRTFELDTAATLHHLPEIVSYVPETPRTARIAVIADKEDYDRFAAANCEVVIVVDYSGSMGDKKIKATGKTRKDTALEALEGCLKKIPNGVKVTLLTFSAAENERNKERLVPLWRKAEWDNGDVAVGKRMKQLRDLTPKNDTPLVRATVGGRDYFTKDFKGAKTLVVITDGGDNTFYPNRDYPDGEGELRREYGKTMETCLGTAFKGTGISLNVIGFRLSELDPDKDKDEYKGYMEYRPAIEKAGGLFTNAEDSAALAEQLERSILQIRFKLDTESGVIPDGAIPPEGGDVSRSLSDFRWVRGLGPGVYNITLNANRIQKAFDQRLRVGRGDSLVLRLVPSPDGTGFQFRRETYVDSRSIKNLNREFVRRDVRDTSWLVSVVQNQEINNLKISGAAQMMAVIEKRDDKPIGPTGAAQSVRPQHVWYQVTTEEQPNKPVQGLRFYPLADYPAPCYSLDFAAWPEKAKARLEVWWNEDAPPDCDILRRTTGVRLADMAPLSREVRPTDQDERTRIVIESITTERRAVEVRPGEVKQDVDCLVVRLRYPIAENSKPFFVQLPPDVAAGAEHRFYTEAGKYTGVFWYVSKEQADRLEYLKIYSVEGVNRKAHHLEPLPLGAPREDSRRPDKPKD